MVIPSHESLGDIPSDLVTRYWPPDDASELAAAIEKALASNPIKNLGAELHRLIKSRDWSAMAKKFVKALDEEVNS